MKFFKNLLVFIFLISSVFFTSDLCAAKPVNLNKITKEELQEEFDAVLKDVTSQLSPSTKKVIFNEIKLITGALISGLGIGVLAYLSAEWVLDLDYDRPYASESAGVYVGLACAVLSYALFKIIDKKIINPKSDIENKLRLLEIMSLLLKDSDKNSVIDALHKLWPFQ